MANMNTINKCLILIIFLFLINHLTNNKLVDIIKNCLNISYKSSNKNLLNEDEILYFNKYINNLIVPKILTLPPRKPEKRILANDNFERLLVNYLYNTFNSRGYTFNNIRLLNKIYYYDNITIKDIEPFNFGSSITYENNNLGTFIFYVDAYIRRDRNVDNLIITNIRFENDNYQNINQPNTRYQSTNNEIRAIERNNSLTKKMEESFNNNFVNRNNYDDLFIKPNKPYKNESFFNDTDNSLIPTINEITVTDSNFTY